MVVVVAPNHNVAVIAVEVTAVDVGIMCMSLSPQLKVPPWIHWWVDWC